MQILIHAFSFVPMLLIGILVMAMSHPMLFKIGILVMAMSHAQMNRAVTLELK